LKKLSVLNYKLNLVAENIAHQLERRIAFRRAVKSSAAATMRAGAKGVRIEVAGRLGGNEMSAAKKNPRQRPLHTIRADIDYAAARAQYPGAGIIGVKVWIYKGEVDELVMLMPSEQSTARYVRERSMAAKPRALSPLLMAVMHLLATKRAHYCPPDRSRPPGNDPLY
jgi:ribosomal protein S3